MYAKSNNDTSIRTNIPVENFDPGPGLGQFAARNQAESVKCTSNVQESQVLQSETQPNSCGSEISQCNNIQPCKKTLPLNLGMDDLLLIFIIFLLLSDSEQDNDILVPILLALLVIF